MDAASNMRLMAAAEKSVLLAVRSSMFSKSVPCSLFSAGDSADEDDDDDGGGATGACLRDVPCPLPAPPLPLPPNPEQVDGSGTFDPRRSVWVPSAGLDCLC